MKHTFLVAHTRSGKQYVLNTIDSLLLPTHAHYIKLNDKLFFMSHRKVVEQIHSTYDTVKAINLTYIPLSEIILINEIELNVPLEAIKDYEMNDKEKDEYNARKLDHEAHHADNVSYPE